MSEQVDSTLFRTVWSEHIVERGGAGITANKGIKADLRAHGPQAAYPKRWVAE